MAPKQATLGKFFGKPNGTISEPQQTKLSFATKAKKIPKDEPATSPPDAPTSSSEPAAADAETVQKDVAMEDAEASSEDAGEAGSDSDIPAAKKPSKTDKPSPTKGLKRKAAVDVDEDGTKKKRARSPSPKGKKGSKATGKKEEPLVQEKNPGKPVTAAESSDVVEEEAKPNSKSKGFRSRKSASPLPEKRTASSKEPKPVPDKEEDAEKSSSEEEEDAVSSEEEDEKSGAAKAAREKVQTTLKGSGKDPYPDWKAGDPVPYAALCTTFSKIEMTTKRLEILAHCSLFLRQVLRLTPQDLLPTILLMINKLAADYVGIELGIGESLIMKAIGESTGRNLKDVKADQNEIGDLGLVAAKSKSKQQRLSFGFNAKPLTVRGVHQALKDIAVVEGQGAQGRKVGAINKLLSAADSKIAGKGSKAVDITKDKGGPSEAKFIVRTLEGKLRLGLAEKTVLVALAQAMVFHEVAQKGDKIPSTEQLASGEKMLKTIYSELPDYEVIIPAMLEHGIFQLRENCKLVPGVPLKPMLAKPTKSITEVLDRFDGKDFTCEYKYDGERAQIHFVAHDAHESYATAAPKEGKSEKGVANIFSRNSEDLSKKYPDILAKLPTWVKEGTKSFVLDCETVAWDVKEKRVLPFQQLMTRKRKDVKTEDITVKVCVFAFDLLFLNGEALVAKSFRERRELLHNAFAEVEGEFKFAQYGNTNELEEIQSLLEESVKASCEGLMVKMLDGPESSYEPSKRSQNWLKVKKDYLSGVGDSLDLVVLGAYFGRGKRTSWYGAFLLACYNPNNETFETVCNIGTGFSEAILEQFHKELSEIAIDRAKPFYVHGTGNKDQPDVWFEPKYVWEVKTADLTLSPRYKAAADEVVNSGGKGVSLRFPRFIKLRDDKKPEQATTSRQIAEMYQRQDAVAKSKGPSVDDDFEY